VYVGPIWDADAAETWEAQHGPWPRWSRPIPWAAAAAEAWARARPARPGSTKRARPQATRPCR